MHISSVVIFPGSVGTDAGRDGNMNGHLMVSYVRNICTKIIKFW